MDMMPFNCAFAQRFWDVHPVQAVNEVMLFDLFNRMILINLESGFDGLFFELVFSD